MSAPEATHRGEDFIFGGSARTITFSDVGKIGFAISDLTKDSKCCPGRTDHRKNHIRAKEKL